MTTTTPRIYVPQRLGTNARSIYPMLAVTSLVSTLLLIMMGAIVRVTGYGLGCPDWPLCYGQVVPPFQIAPWVEFTHRLLGGLTSLQIVTLAVLAWREFRSEKWIFRPAVAVVGLLAVQIALGGLHVIFEIPPATGWVHTGVAMAIVALVASQVAVAHPAAQSFSARTADIVRDRGLPVAIATMAAVTYLLLLTGSFVTRSGASLVCPSFPNCGVEATSAAMRGLIDIQMLHRFTAFGVALTAVFTLIRLIRAGRGERSFWAVAAVLSALIVAQFGLGISNVMLRLPMWSRTLHLLVAALLWTGMVMLWVVVRRGIRLQAV